MLQGLSKLIGLYSSLSSSVGKHGRQRKHGFWVHHSTGPTQWRLLMTLTPLPILSIAVLDQNWKSYCSLNLGSRIDHLLVVISWWKYLSLGQTPWRKVTKARGNNVERNQWDWGGSISFRLYYKREESCNTYSQEKRRRIDWKGFKNLIGCYGLWFKGVQRESKGQMTRWAQ